MPSARLLTSMASRCAMVEDSVIVQCWAPGGQQTQCGDFHVLSSLLRLLLLAILPDSPPSTRAELLSC